MSRRRLKRYFKRKALPRLTHPSQRRFLDEFVHNQMIVLDQEYAWLCEIYA